jgi:hypothetical protein
MDGDERLILDQAQQDQAPLAIILPIVDPGQHLTFKYQCRMEGV